MPKQLNELFLHLNINPKNERLFLQALTHSSYANEHKNKNKIDYPNYERLEILGDAVVSKIVIEYFFKKHSDWNEEQINDAKKRVVQSLSMAKASDELHLIDYTLLGNGVDIERSGRKIKEDIFEAFIGALYLDQGEQECFEILKKTVIKYYLNNEIEETIDHKTKIQEIFQSKEFRHGDRKDNKIIYQNKQVNNSFESYLIFNEIIYGIGIGKTKKEAEQNAAKHALEKLETNIIN